MTIDFYFWAECPSHDDALARLRTVLAEERVADHVAIHEVVSDEEAEALEFPGSPTIRIDGADVDPVGADAEEGYGLTCRVYRAADGRMSPLPPIELLRERVRLAAS